MCRNHEVAVITTGPRWVTLVDGREGSKDLTKKKGYTERYRKNTYYARVFAPFYRVACTQHEVGDVVAVVLGPSTLGLADYRQAHLTEDVLVFWNVPITSNTITYVKFIAIQLLYKHPV